MPIFTPAFNVVSNSQVQIPVGTKGYTIIIDSGSAYINGQQVNSPFTYKGGGYDKFYLGTGINVGCTGGRAIVTWEQ